MENLERDPIIEFYLSFSQIPRISGAMHLESNGFRIIPHLSSLLPDPHAPVPDIMFCYVLSRCGKFKYLGPSTVQESAMPTFSETLLRLAARHALGNVRPVEAETLALYRKLILFHYAETYTAVDDLAKIMPCFTAKELLKCFEDYENTKREWETFTKNNLLYFIRKKAFFAVFTEWTRRYMQIYDELDSDKLRSQATKIHKFFQWGTKGINQWVRSFESNTLKGNWADSDSTIKLETVTEKDLRISNIVNDIKYRLHPLICKEVEEILMERNGGESSDGESENSEKRSNISPIPAKRIRRTNKPKTSEQQETLVQTIQIHSSDIAEPGEEGEIVQVLEIFDPESDAHDDSSTTTDKEEDNDTETVEISSIVNDDKATAYLSALQAYVVVNGLYDAIPLLDRVDSILRAKLENEKKSAESSVYNGE